MIKVVDRHDRRHKTLSSIIPTLPWAVASDRFDIAAIDYLMVKSFDFRNF